VTQTTLDGSSSPFVINAGTIIQANDGDQLVLLGTIDNNGEILVNGTGTAYGSTPAQADVASVVVSSPTVVLAGTGALQLNGGEFGLVYASGPGTPTLINESNTITGAGYIGVGSTPQAFSDTGTIWPLLFVNGTAGVVDATDSTNSLAIDAGTLTVTNAGLMEATAAGGLLILAGTLANTDGTILASGAGNLVTLFDAFINGGEIIAENGGGVAINGALVQTGSVYQPSADVLSGVTLSTPSGGTIAINGTLDGAGEANVFVAGAMIQPANLTLTGTIAGSGTVVFSGPYSNTFDLMGSIDNLGTVATTGTNQSVETLVSTIVSLSGGGTWVLPDYILPSTTVGATLDNIDNLITGSGAIGYADGQQPVALINEAHGIVDANAGEAITIWSGTLADSNAGLIEATGGSSFSLTAGALNNTGGTILASGASSVTIAAGTLTNDAGTIAASGSGDVVTLNGDAIAGGVLSVGAGATIAATGTLGSAVDPVALSVAPTGAILVSGSNLLIGGLNTLTGGGTLTIGYEGSVGGGSGAGLVNDGGTIDGIGLLGGTGSGLQVINQAGGMITGLTIDLPAGLTNDALVEAIGSTGLTIQGATNAPSSIDDSNGGTLLASSGSLSINAGLVTGGLLAANPGQTIYLGDNTTLTGGSTPLTIAAGTTLQAYYVAYSPPFYLTFGTSVTLAGTIDNAGTIVTATDAYGGGSTVNQGLFEGTGGFLGDSIINNGTLLASGGMLFANSVAGTGDIALAPGATFELNGATSETINFQGGSHETLLLQSPLSYSTSNQAPTVNDHETLANLAIGDTIDFGGPGVSTAAIVNANTLAVELQNGLTLDYALNNFAAGATAVVATPPPDSEYYSFTYTGTQTSTGSTVTGTGWFAVNVVGGTASLADVTTFDVQYSVPSPYYNTGYINDGLSDLQSFSATFGANDVLTGLSLTASGTNPFGTGGPNVFTITSLSAGGASDSLNGSVGSVIVAAPTQQATGVAIVPLVCFVEGTRIATPDGEIPVEQLAIGGKALTASREARSIVWIGSGRVLATRGRRTAATPVIVRKGAFADNVPHHDLHVTKGHSLYIDGVLIPVEFLVNHRSILWDDRAQEVVIYHIELETHDILLANGAPAESYRDDGNRWLFQNANSGWDLPPKEPCAPVLTGGPVVDAVWRRLLDRAGLRKLPPLTDDANLHLIVDGMCLNAPCQTNGVYVFCLPETPSRARIASRSAVPAELGLARDPRRLGVAVRRVVLRKGARFRIIDANDPRLLEGFHTFEADNGFRWTDGNAILPRELFDGFAGPCELVLHVAMTTRYVDEGDVRRVA
jgi:hypothetical protein